MALSPAEKQRRYRERRIEKARLKMLDTPGPASYLRRPFSAFVGDRTFELHENLDAFGVHIGGNFLDEEMQHFGTQYQREQPLTALQRAEGLVDVFIDAAKEIAHVIHLYKLEEIKTAIDEAIERSSHLPRGDVEGLKRSFAEIDRLKTIQTQLRKATRHTVLATRAEGEAEFD